MVSSMSNDILTKRTGYCFLFFEILFANCHFCQIIVPELNASIHLFIIFLFTFLNMMKEKILNTMQKSFNVFLAFPFFLFSSIESSYRKVSYSIFLILNQLQALKNRKLVQRHEACIIYKKLSNKSFLFRLLTSDD